jgi:hypothetical protein
MTKASMTRAAAKFNTAKFPKRSEKVTRMVSSKPLVSARPGKVEVMSRF